MPQRLRLSHSIGRVFSPSHSTQHHSTHPHAPDVPEQRPCAKYKDRGQIKHRVLNKSAVYKNNRGVQNNPAYPKTTTVHKITLRVLNNPARVYETKPRCTNNPASATKSRGVQTTPRVLQNRAITNNPANATKSRGIQNSPASAQSRAVYKITPRVLKIARCTQNNPTSATTSRGVQKTDIAWLQI